MKKGMEDNAQETVSTDVALAIEEADQSVFSQTEDGEVLNMDSLFLMELFKAFYLPKETEDAAFKKETEPIQKLQKVSLTNLIIERTGAVKMTHSQYRGFDPQNYFRLKKQHIICRNGGAKLTFETLVELAHVGARLIPSLSF